MQNKAKCETKVRTINLSSKQRLGEAVSVSEREAEMATPRPSESVGMDEQPDFLGRLGGNQQTNGETGREVREESPSNTGSTGRLKTSSERVPRHWR